MGVSDDHLEVCHLAMLHDKMDISRMMVDSQQVKESRIKMKIKDAKRERYHEVGTSNDKTRNDRVSNVRSQRRRGGDSRSEKPTCTICGKKHVGECLVRSDTCFGCLKSGYKERDFPIVKGQGKRNNQAQASGPSSDAPKKNRFYALRLRGDQKNYPNVVTGMLQVFSIDVYALLNPRATLSFVNPLVSMKFDVLSDVSIEPLPVTTPVVDSIVAKRVFRSCTILLSNRVKLVDLVKLDMLDFHVIFGMN
ncbi:uncharacterized protein LOC107001562 [Solanum pennellii]|uniref:Uncharacterized protein LOC107001562 n=1 Tax=Solanum pennellii TaxID=28526 RepID=A0ABM1FCR6_SOLPN|nr:uncharacterized protein LOC107001562 [Solanum pennellii]